MTITEAHHTATLLRFAAGTSNAPAEHIRESFDYLAGRAGQALDVQIRIDGHDIDAAITRAESSR